MRTTTRALVVLILILMGMILALAPPALWADSAILPGVNLFSVNPNASGTKVAGPLALYFDVIGTGTPLCENDSSLHVVDMFIVMRLKLGTNTFAFAPGGPTRLCYERTANLVTTVKNFVSGTVIPLLFPPPQCENPITCWQLKDVANFHQDGELESCPIDSATQDCASYWAVMDITIAVNP